MTSVVIPAHNEARVLGRLLSGLLDDARPDELDIVVVANGCTDETESVARAHGVRVVTTPVPSKREALRLGDRAARGFPRLYVDADVTLSTAGVRALTAPLDGSGTLLATAPERDLALADRPWAVRLYYAVWTRLPHVRAGLFGRGVIAVTEEGNDRIRSLPAVMADDLAVSLAFADDERAVVAGARAGIQTPRTFADLLRRRVRAATGIHEWEQVSGSGGPSARTTVGDLVGIVLREPWLLPAATVFVGVTVLARGRARPAIRAGDYTTWLRDDSSRATGS
ncbi:glycosyltransferase [Microbispora corallina]|uniref:glycosyltransferase n=1 Tax=Microbispora corallina TaxID=83302 RepID=UPI0019518C38|nr:glycosyltransferase [Microbispora corallina]